MGHIFVAGLPKDLAEEQLLELFGRCGTVVKLKVLRPGFAAFIQMATVEEATIAVEDLNFETPVGFSAPLTVRYLNSRPQEYFPEGMILGTVKTWHQKSRRGEILVVGFDHDVAFCGTDCTDAEPPVGSTVLFCARWFDEHWRYCAQNIVCIEANIQAILAGTSGVDKAIRDCARSIEARLRCETAT